MTSACTRFSNTSDIVERRLRIWFVRKYLSTTESRQNLVHSASPHTGAERNEQHVLLWLLTVKYPDVVKVFRGHIEESAAAKLAGTNGIGNVTTKYNMISTLELDVTIDLHIRKRHSIAESPGYPPSIRYAAARSVKRISPRLN